MREIKDVLNKWDRHIMFMDYYIIKHSNMLTRHTLAYRFKAVSIKMPSGFFVDKNKMFTKFIWEIKGIRIAKTILKKKKVGELHMT